MTKSELIKKESKETQLEIENAIKKDENFLDADFFVIDWVTGFVEKIRGDGKWL